MTGQVFVHISADAKSLNLNANPNCRQMGQVGHVICMGNWTTRGLPTLGLDISQTRQLADWTSCGLDNSRSRRCCQKNEN